MRYRWWDAVRANVFIACKEMECGKKEKELVTGEITRFLFDFYPIFIIFQLYTLPGREFYESRWARLLA